MYMRRSVHFFSGQYILPSSIYIHGARRRHSGVRFIVAKLLHNVRAAHEEKRISKTKALKFPVRK